MFGGMLCVLLLLLLLVIIGSFSSSGQGLGSKVVPASPVSGSVQAVGGDAHWARGDDFQREARVKLKLGLHSLTSQPVSERLTEAHDLAKALVQITAPPVSPSSSAPQQKHRHRPEEDGTDVLEKEIARAKSVLAADKAAFAKWAGPEVIDAADAQWSPGHMNDEDDRRGNRKGRGRREERLFGREDVRPQPEWAVGSLRRGLP